MTEYLTIKEICRELGVSESSMRRYIKKGLPCYRVGVKKIVFDKQETIDWLVKKI